MARKKVEQSDNSPDWLFVVGTGKSLYFPKGMVFKVRKSVSEKLISEGKAVLQ